jgi:hypothetical protein
LEQCNLKFANKDTGVFEGYASVFNSTDKVGDTILPGAFMSSISKRLPKMFVNHKQSDVPVGDWTDMKEDEHGLKAKGVIDLNHKDGPTVFSALKRGAMDGLSIGFTMSEGDFEKKSEGGRNIKNMNLMEASIVNFPCEGQALITAVKADILLLKDLKDFESYMRDVCGLSRSLAKTYVSQFRDCVLRDAVNEHEEKDMEQLMTALTSLRNKLK